MATQYELIIKNGETETENGYFFKASPFDIQVGDATLSVIFERNEGLHVVYKIASNGSKALELTHPDYADVSADNLAATISDSPISYEVLYAALVRLEITKDKDLVEHFKTTPFSGDLKVTQSALFS